MGRPASRLGDSDVPHCSPMLRATGSFNVFINGRPAVRQLDINTPHLKPGGNSCVPHVAPVAVGSLTVRINGRGAARLGDSIAGCTLVGMGSFNVFIGG